MFPCPSLDDAAVEAESRLRAVPVAESAELLSVGVDPAAVTPDQPPHLERVENARHVLGCADDETPFHEHVRHGLSDGAKVISRPVGPGHVSSRSTTVISPLKRRNTASWPLARPLCAFTLTAARLAFNARLLAVEGVLALTLELA
jgi:hypothetical protein